MGYFKNFIYILHTRVALHVIEIRVIEKAEVRIGNTFRYDESDEEDLFGEMNERDFGSKGITDADFSFFDDPERRPWPQPPIRSEDGILQ
jgi:hypothetical protein